VIVFSRNLVTGNDIDIQYRIFAAIYDRIDTDSSRTGGYTFDSYNRIIVILILGHGTANIANDILVFDYDLDDTLVYSAGISNYFGLDLDLLILVDNDAVF
jgi:hypothetical protein